LFFTVKVGIFIINVFLYVPNTQKLENEDKSFFYRIGYWSGYNLMITLPPVYVSIKYTVNKLRSVIMGNKLAHGLNENQINAEIGKKLNVGVKHLVSWN